jgi:DNA-binding response OmpR family regulator
MDSYVLGKEDLLSEIERNKPDIVFIDMGLYARIDGIETSKIIRSLFKVPVMYV